MFQRKQLINHGIRKERFTSHASRDLLIKLSLNFTMEHLINSRNNHKDNHEILERTTDNSIE